MIWCRGAGTGPGHRRQSLPGEQFKTPIISILVGGSSGALALDVSDALWIMGNTYYSVISPEGCASILWNDSSKIGEAAESLKITHTQLLASSRSSVFLANLG